VTSQRLTTAFAAIDAANAGDPHSIEIDGETRPKELAHAELMTRWVSRLDPDATDAQLLAARAHHLRRWESPRRAFPDGRAGYLRWRAEAKRRHADDVAAILRECGYDDDTIERVQQIVRKDHLRTDPMVQTHEDALCLVFLQTQLGDIVDQLGAEKAVDVLQRTVAKMTPSGREHACALALDDDHHSLVVAAVEQLGA
jgi:hypothetical protein